MRGTTLIDYVLAVPGIGFALALHEYVKALVSYRLGDPYPKLHGRLRLSPKRHFEPIGFLFMLLYGYGWGLPVKTASTYYKNRKTATLIVHTAPSLTNVLAAFVFFMLLIAARQFSIATGLDLPLNSQGASQSIQTIGGLGYGFADMLSPEPLLILLSGALYQIFYVFARCNMAAAFISIIPIYPLDGAVVLENCLPPEYRRKYAQYRPMLTIALMLLFISGAVNYMFDPVVQIFLRPIQ